MYNALHIDAHFELDKVFGDSSPTPSNGSRSSPAPATRRFCAGNDLNAGRRGQARLDKGGFAGGDSRVYCDKPTIAAVNGVAMGGGFEIALACDLIIASEQSTFALPEPRVGSPRSLAACAACRAGYGWSVPWA